MEQLSRPEVVALTLMPWMAMMISAVSAWFWKRAA